MSNENDSIYVELTKMLDLKSWKFWVIIFILVILFTSVNIINSLKQKQPSETNTKTQVLDAAIKADPQYPIIPETDTEIHIDHNH